MLGLAAPPLLFALAVLTWQRGNLILPRKGVPAQPNTNTIAVVICSIIISSSCHMIMSHVLLDSILWHPSSSVSPLFCISRISIITCSHLCPFILFSWLAMAWFRGSSVFFSLGGCLANMDVWLHDVWINCCAVVVFQASQDCCLCGKGDPPIPLAQYGNIIFLVPMDLEVTLAHFENKTFESRSSLLAKQHGKKQWRSCFFPEKQSWSSTNDPHSYVFFHDLSAHLGRWLLQPWFLDLHHPVCHSSTSQLRQQFPGIPASAWNTHLGWAAHCPSYFAPVGRVNVA